MFFTWPLLAARNMCTRQVIDRICALDCCTCHGQRMCTGGVWTHVTCMIDVTKNADLMSHIDMSKRTPLMSHIWHVKENTDLMSHMTNTTENSPHVTHMINVTENTHPWVLTLGVRGVPAEYVGDCEWEDENTSSSTSSGLSDMLSTTRLILSPLCRRSRSRQLALLWW